MGLTQLLLHPHAYEFDDEESGAYINLAGVKAVITPKDVPQIPYNPMFFMPMTSPGLTRDMLMLSDTVRYAGQPIAAVAAEYKVAYGQNSQAKPGQILVDHSTGILVKDKKGKLRLLVKNDVAVADLESDVRVLLRER